MLSIGLANPKNVSNVGSVMRAAGCFDVDAVYYSGSRFDRARSFDTDPRNIADSIPLTHCSNLTDGVTPHQAVVCVEFALGAQSLTTFKHPPSAFYLFGPEDGSLTQHNIDTADHIVFVPTAGCLNLAASVNVVLYDRLAKSSAYNAVQHDDELILRSRDCRNRLQLKES